MAHSNTGGHLYYLKSREGQKKKKRFPCYYYNHIKLHLPTAMD